MNRRKVHMLLFSVLFLYCTQLDVTYTIQWLQMKKQIMDKTLLLVSDHLIRTNRANKNFSCLKTSSFSYFDQIMKYVGFRHFKTKSRDIKELDTYIFNMTLAVTISLFLLYIYLKNFMGKWHKILILFGGTRFL